MIFQLSPPNLPRSAFSARCRLTFSAPFAAAGGDRRFGQRLLLQYQNLHRLALPLGQARQRLVHTTAGDKTSIGRPSALVGKGFRKSSGE